MSHHRHQSGCDVSLSQIVYRQVCRHSKESQVLLAHHACRASLYRFDVYRQTQYRSVLWPRGSQHPTPLIPHSSALLSQTVTRCVMARFHSPCEGAGLAVVVRVFHAVRFASAEAMNDVPEWPEHSRTCEYLLKKALRRLHASDQRATRMQTLAAGAPHFHPGTQTTPSLMLATLQMHHSGWSNVYRTCSRCWLPCLSRAVDCQHTNIVHLPTDWQS